MAFSFWFWWHLTLLSSTTTTTRTCACQCLLPACISISISVAASACYLFLVCVRAWGIVWRCQNGSIHIGDAVAAYRATWASRPLGCSCNIHQDSSSSSSRSSPVTSFETSHAVHVCASVFAFGLCTQGAPLSLPPPPPASGNLCHVLAMLYYTHLACWFWSWCCAFPLCLACSWQGKLKSPTQLEASQSFISLLFIYLTNGIICCHAPALPICPFLPHILPSRA